MASNNRNPRDIVVMQRETPFPTLRAHLRGLGFNIPPAFARTSWGPPVLRNVTSAASAPIPQAQERTPPAPAPRPQTAEPRPPAPAQPVRQQDAVTSDQRPAGYPGPSPAPPPPQALFADDPDFDNPEEIPTGSYEPIPGQAGSQPQMPSANPYAPPQQPAVGPSYGGGFEPSTMQIDAAQAAAIADRMGAPGVGESTTQASHRAERLDLSEWGYLLRIVMIADPRDPNPRTLLEQMRPDVGAWLQAEIDQPARLEYDRRFRRDVEKHLAKYLTERIARFPVIKADIQFVE